MVYWAMPHRRSRELGRFCLAWCLVVCVISTLEAGYRPGRASAVEPAPLVQRSLFGAFVAEGPRHTMVDDPTLLPAYERLLGARVQVASYFYGFGDVFPGRREVELAAGGRRAVLLAWDMGSTSDHRFTAWASGRYDRYLRRVGRAAAAYPYQVYVRPWPEMNADWVPFQPTPSGSQTAGGTPAQFIRAWRHVVDTVRGAGGTNIRWIFNPTVDVYPETTDVRRIWPGAGWVDVLGLDGYNWGTLPAWRTFADLFDAQYDRLTGLAPTLPVWVCEYGSREPAVEDGAPIDPSHDKGAWLTDVFSSARWPRIQALVHFDIRKERDWRFASSAAALTAARSALASRPAPSTRRGLAALGVVGLPPTLRRTRTGDRVVSWGRTQDPATVRYQVQVRTPVRRRWVTAATTRRLGWTTSTPTAWTGVRVRGLAAGGSVRWTSLPWSTRS
jgi:hypothetical protein